MDNLLNKNQFEREEWQRLDLFPMLTMFDALRENTTLTPDGRPVFLRADDSFAIALSQVRSLTESKNGRPIEATTSYLSLLRPEQGARLSADTLFRDHRVGKAALDILHHRLLWHLFDLWKETRLHRMLPQILDRLRITLGIARSLLKDDELLFMARWLVREERSANALESLLTEYFHKTFHVQWNDVHESVKISLFFMSADEKERFNPYAEDASDNAIGSLIAMCRVFLGEGTPLLIELHVENESEPNTVMKLGESRLNWSTRIPGEKSLPILVRPAPDGRGVAG